MCRPVVFFLFFFKLIGLATFSVIIINPKKKHEKGTVQLIWTRLGIYYNALISCLIIAANYVTIPLLYYDDYLRKTTITTAIEIVEGVMGSIITSTILLYYCVNQSMFVKVGNSLIDVLDELYRHREPVDRKRIVSTLLFIYLLELGLLSALAITDYIAFQSNPLTWMGNIVPTGFISWLFIQYYSMLLVIHAVFVKLNKIIRNVCVNKTTDTQMNYLYRSRRVFINGTGIQSLVQLRCIHSHVCDISMQVSQFYSLPILSGTILIFFGLLYNTYYFFEPITVNVIILDPLVALNTVIWIIFLLYPLGLLTTKVTNIGNEMKQTGSIVHALLNYTIDREARAELKLFSLQLLHRKLKFTAIGYFALDNTLFQSVLSTVTTYLVILIQFQMGTPSSIDHNCNYTHSCDGRED